MDKIVDEATKLRSCGFAYVRQHQGVEAGKSFEQLVQAGMRTAQLDQIVRQKDPELPRAVEHLSRGEVAEGVAMLEQGIPRP